MKNNYLITTILIVIFAGVGFYGGMKYQQSQKGNFSGQLADGQGMLRNNRMGTGVNNRGGLRPIAGDIISADEKSITVKLQDDSSKIVLINDKTVINKAQTVTKSELKVGEKVSVFGSTNTDGSVTAQNIQLNPIQRMGGDVRPSGVVPTNK
jgi:hypothetical protein